MSSLLLTVIFLLADGSPAKDATVACPGVLVSRVGSDSGEAAEDGAALVLDSRGAFVLNLAKPTKITCWAAYNTQRWQGTLQMQKVQRIYLEEVWEE